ncbi:MAG: D-arginine dehydrogenase [Candidatus Omnitrophota bacterium]|jgi:D-arginine dehydrogenase
MATKKYDYMVMGGGFAGLSTAYALAKAKAGKICIIEKEYKLGLGASSKNASMLCQLVRDPITCGFMIDSVKSITEQWSKEFKKAPFLNCGSLHIGRLDDLRPFATSVEVASGKGVMTALLSRKETLARFQHLKSAEFEAALWCPSDGVIDTQALIDGLTQVCKDMGVSIFKSTNGLPQKDSEGYFILQTSPTRNFRSKVLINAAGAWVNQVNQKLTAQNIQTKAMRRHIFITQDFEETQTHKPIVWDVDHEIYYRPHNKALLLSPCDEEEFAPGTTEVDLKAKELLLQKSKHFLPEIQNTKFSRMWSGLRTFSPDKRFVIGWDAECKNLFWNACLGGYGLTASAAAGKLASDLILGKKAEPLYTQAYNPNRFANIPTTSPDLELAQQDQR